MTPRSYRLTPWLVRALVPQRQIGTYVLYRDDQPIYIGRSDRDLRQRLLQHAATRRGDTFTYDTHQHPHAAFDAECSLFHALDVTIENVIHPDAPNFLRATCPFCPETLEHARRNRLTRDCRTAPTHTNPAGTETSRPRTTQEKHYVR